jgi:hypothetical protein
MPGRVLQPRNSVIQIVYQPKSRRNALSRFVLTALLWGSLVLFTITPPVGPPLVFFSRYWTSHQVA